MNKNKSWLARQFWNQTFDDDVEVNIDKVLELLDMCEDHGEAD